MDTTEELDRREVGSPWNFAGHTDFVRIKEEEAMSTSSFRINTDVEIDQRKIAGRATIKCVGLIGDFLWECPHIEALKTIFGCKGRTVLFA